MLSGFNPVAANEFLPREGHILEPQDQREYTSLTDAPFPSGPEHTEPLEAA